MSMFVDRRIRDGREVFRVWSMNTDAYITGELSAEELAAWLREDAIQDAIRRTQDEMPDLLKRARARNTSDRYERGTFAYYAPWRES